jgi:hypothetical protein
MNEQSRFVRALEAEYAARIAGAEAAHELVFEDVKALGRAALDELGRRGLFPWPAEPEGGHA